MTSILIVDDAAFARRMIRKILELEGYETMEAESGRAGLEMVRLHRPDCILTDLLMPDMDGFEFLKALTEQEIKIPVIIISADIQEGSRREGFELGAAGFVNKPPKKDELCNAVREAVMSKPEGTSCN